MTQANESFIVFGAKQFGYASIKSGVSGALEFDKPVMMPGMREFSSELEQNNTSIYADDVVYATIDGAKKRTAEAKVLYIPQAYAEMALGYVKETNGMLVDSGNKKSHCIFYVETAKNKETNEETQILHYFYNVTATEGELESTTVEDDVQAKTMSIKFNCANSSIAKDSKGNPVAYGKIVKTDQNKTLFDKFTTQVLLPTTSVA